MVLRSIEVVLTVVLLLCRAQVSRHVHSMFTGPARCVRAELASVSYIGSIVKITTYPGGVSRGPRGRQNLTEFDGI